MLKLVDNLFYHLNIKAGLFKSSHDFRHAKDTIVSAYHFNEILKSILSSNSPLLLGRVGGTESRIFRVFSNNFGKESANFASHCEKLSGIYPHNELSLYYNLIVDDLPFFHFLADWPCPGQSKLKAHLNRNNINPFYYNLEYLNPLSMHFIYGINPSDLWMHSLSYKKILVINPFIDSFKKSVTRSISIFEKSLLPDLNCTYFSPPVTFGTSGVDNGSFMMHLEKTKALLHQLCLDNSFDCALVAAGGYGMPISRYLYSNKLIPQVLHIGGVLQLFFGVIGQRWLDEPYKSKYSQYQNLHLWSRPVDYSVMKRASQVENGCYL